MTLWHTDQPVTASHDWCFLDLDGVVYRSHRAVPAAVDALGQVTSSGLRLCYLTNNASRTPEQVAEHLRFLGLTARSSDVVTSAMAIAELMAKELSSGASVFMVGDLGLEEALTNAGLQPVREKKPLPQAVVQGHSPTTSWQHLADAAMLIASGVPWYASNTDASVPTQDGLAPGNGAFVGILRDLTQREPTVAGKPFRPLFDHALRQTGAQSALMIGDRLDTDIEGARKEGLASAWVETGVHHLSDVMNALPPSRPDYVMGDLSGLLRSQPSVRVERNTSTCGSAVVEWDGDSLVLVAPGQHREEELRAATTLAWHIRDADDVKVVPDDTLEP